MRSRSRREGAHVGPPGRGENRPDKPGGVFQPDRATPGGATGGKVPPELAEAVWRINRFMDALDELIDVWFGDVKDPEVLEWIKSAPELKEKLIDRIMTVITMR